MDAKELRKVFLRYFQRKGHSIVGGSSLIPENDPSVLFTTAGMHPLVPFLMGEPHPAGRRLVDYQKCVRTDDIAVVGDDVHLTFFEMLGSWSLGDYWKEEAISMSFEFLTRELGLEPSRIFITCFGGDADSPKDTETYQVWRSLGIKDDRIMFLSKKDNWWGPVGTTGPCGPDTEMFYDMRPRTDVAGTPRSDPNRFWEIWNDVFMQYNRRADGTYETLRQRNVDTGMGLERTLAILENVTSLYQTELFAPIVDEILSLARQPSQFAVRVIADHIRSAVFILSEGISPGNVDQPYVARRLIRRVMRYAREIQIEDGFLCKMAETTIETMSGVYSELKINRNHILAALEKEETQFRDTLQKGEKHFARIVQECADRGRSTIDGESVFQLHDTYGFPPELTQELAEQRGLMADLSHYDELFKLHQEKSRQGAAGKFKGGLAEHSSATVKLHTATHVLNESLRRVLGPHVAQKGSNITSERLRFDFSHPQKVTEDQLKAVEQMVNNSIRQNLPVNMEEMPIESAKSAGAIGVFTGKYGDMVKVYSIGQYSKEICGGPHVASTGMLGTFAIIKEEAVSAGVRRIRATLR